jgi:uncharacterized membrane protein YdbT with pleckstrin-like domain
MDNNISAGSDVRPAINLREFNRLGHKTFFLFIWKRSWAIILILLAGAVILTFASDIPADYILFANLAMVVLFVLLVITTMITILFAWLEYIHYKIILSADDITISRGFISEEEVGVPFRRIKEVKFERNLMDQILGVSNVILIVLGDEENSSLSSESKITLPSLDSRIAKQIQGIVLNKAEVEEIDMAPSVSTKN